MDFTTDKLRSLVRKWQTLIEAYVDVKTTDGYFLRLFCISFTKKRIGQVKKTAYAQASQVCLDLGGQNFRCHNSDIKQNLPAFQIRTIRKKMTEIMTREAGSCDLKDLVAKFIPEAIGKEIEKACQGIYPLQNTYIRKVKVLKAPKFDLTKLMEVRCFQSSRIDSPGMPLCLRNASVSSPVSGARRLLRGGWRQDREACRCRGCRRARLNSLR